MEIYCLKCKKKTDTINEHETTTKNNIPNSVFVFFFNVANFQLIYAVVHLFYCYLRQGDRIPGPAPKGQLIKIIK